MEEIARDRSKETIHAFEMVGCKVIPIHEGFKKCVGYNNAPGGVFLGEIARANDGFTTKILTEIAHLIGGNKSEKGGIVLLVMMYSSKMKGLTTLLVEAWVKEVQIIGNFHAGKENRIFVCVIRESLALDSLAVSRLARWHRQLAFGHR